MQSRSSLRLLRQGSYGAIEMDDTESGLEVHFPGGFEGFKGTRAGEIRWVGKRGKVRQARREAGEAGWRARRDLSCTL